ncbi:MAG: hypothetical protein HFI05_05040 [Lachnospiraceae bacterium]|jgi:hypothetical protein|nr:hypothetical protein [Lachnospiraceae bacterium]
MFIEFFLGDIKNMVLALWVDKKKIGILLLALFWLLALKFFGTVNVGINWII